MLESIDGVCTITRHGPARPVPDLVIEIPHGATRTADYDTLRARLVGTIAADLVDFFHVNTDAGAPELAEQVALTLAERGHATAIVRCRIPRTFIDCNRVIDLAPEAYKAGRVTPGVPPWISHPADLELLTSLHRAYVTASTALIDATCGAGGFTLFLHTYAPRSVDVEVDADIVANLRRAWQPDVVPTWPLRPEVDLIGRTLEGESMVPEALRSALVAGYAALGVEVADGRTYPMHPSTMAFHHAQRHPGRTACVEVRRDLLATPFTPFAEMKIGQEEARRLAGPLADAVRATFSPARPSP